MRKMSDTRGPLQVAGKVSEKLREKMMAAMTINTSDKTDIVAKTMKKMVDGQTCTPDPEP